MKKALIISGGAYSPVESISYNVCIACDRGADHAQRMNIVPDYIIGDFDSLQSFDLNTFPNERIISFPSRKDDTDTNLAIKHALSLGCDDFTFICGLGNRLDHTIANIQCLHSLAMQGYSAKLLSENEILYAISSKETASIKKIDGFSLSLFSLTDECQGLSIKGSEYDVENVTLTNHFPLGVSNHFSEEVVEIKVDCGILLIVLSRLQ